MPNLDSPRRTPGIRRATALTALALSVVVLAPGAHAQAIDDIMQQSTGHALSAWSYLMNAFCWILGSILLIMCGLGWYQHQRNPNAGSRPGMLVAAGVLGGVFLAFPFFAKTASFTIFNSGPTVTGEQQQMRFDR
ncbi:hypothetical protein HLH26_08000 [Gluconacetobacter sp. 1b LMG 1731]|uniref:DUF4134 domain-containing protein n=1 Tax=Gluconacetobacter dulcium TaxID=2729096 RepID=A0A7W4IKG2_9PROT|nr:hypothetical protein [Gluconacetobacter dulcium]MBB2164482.1 hypothetical protein [Gluconacetobacter dulcium]MBB2193751.1 hypothetical protein [Gluconacetobacter dulcium]